jgi:hypothetical protein
MFTGRILFQKKHIENNNIPVSLFYTVRNEETRLKYNLAPVLSINESEFEVVVVNNFSEDNSFQVLGMLRERSDRLKISTMHQETRSSTKMAQNLALKAASYDWVMAMPITYENASSDWISGISKAIEDNKTVVMNYCSLIPKKGLINLICRIETFLAFTKSVGYIKNNLPFVYSEENVAFKKKKYFEFGGHRFKIHEPYANLELLINHFIRKKETTILYQSETAIKKTENPGWPDYMDILKKGFRIEKHLKWKMKLALVLDDLTKLLFPIVTIMTFIFLPGLWIPLSALLLIMFLARLFIIKTAQNRLNERKIFIPSLVYDLVVPYIKLFYGLYFKNRRQKQRWKMKV